MKHGLVSLVTNNTLKLINENVPKTNNLELVILKGHILLEYLMNQIIDLKSRKEYNIKESTFSFNQKSDILIILNVLNQKSRQYQCLKIINKLRNQIAHSFTIDLTLVDKLIQVGFKDTSLENITPKNDSERAKAIRDLIPFLSGMITALLPRILK